MSAAAATPGRANPSRWLCAAARSARPYSILDVYGAGVRHHILLCYRTVGNRLKRGVVQAENTALNYEQSCLLRMHSGICRRVQPIWPQFS